MTRRAVSFKEIEGQTEFKWTPRSYNVLPDLGGVTGPQATLNARAYAALGQCLLLLDGLYALSTKSARQDLDTLGGTVRSQPAELVRELGKEGGPRVSRSDQLFTELLGNSPKAACTQAGGEIGALRDRFGQREFADTVEDEQNQTNFMIFDDYLMKLRRSWDTQKSISSHDN